MPSKITPFSKASESNSSNPHVRDGSDTRFFSQDCPSSTDASRRERQGSGPARDMFDDRFYSNFSGKGATHPTGDGAIARDAGGFPIYSSDISSGAQEIADGIRKRAR
jgi:hypothetical protein